VDRLSDIKLKALAKLYPTAEALIAT